MRSNTRRVLDNVVSVDAWHTAFSEDDGVATVHVDVSFLLGKFGDEPESHVRFEIMIRRAEIVFVIPDGEPLKVLQASVKREKLTEIRTSTTTIKESEAFGKASASLDASAKIGHLNISAGGNASQGKVQKIETEQSTSPVVWQQSKTAEGDYRWEVKPALAPALLGKIWDAVAEPILNIKRVSRLQDPIEAVSRIEIRCRREDILIRNLETKDNGLLDRLTGSRFAEQKKAAAEAFIRNALSSRDLNIVNFSDPFGAITLADVVLDKQVS